MDHVPMRMKYAFTVSGNTSMACVQRMMVIGAVRHSSAHEEVIMRLRRMTFDDARRCLTAHGWRTARKNHRMRKQRSRRMEE